MLNVIIGIFAVYLILSFLCSAVQEAIAGWIHLRGNMLKGAMEQMLTNAPFTDQEKKDDSTATEPSSKTDLSIWQKFQEHNWFQGIKRPKLSWMQSMLSVTKYPSKMDGSTFSTILVHVLNRENDDFKDILAGINKMKDGRLKTFLHDMAMDAENDLDKFRTNVSTWYDHTMKEVSVWYKNRAHTILFIIGLVVAGILNADTFAIYAKLSNNPASQKELLSFAQGLVERDMQKPQSIQYDSTVSAQLDSLQGQIQGILSDDIGMIYSPLGLGWKKADMSKMVNWDWWLMKVLGILITTFAIAMGASFWFNVLRKLLNFRSGLQREGTQQNE